jgi:glycerophosphoryl diester phosphodiesterase
MFHSKLLIVFCLIAGVMMGQTIHNPQIFGHRGCRGILPENTLMAFKKAIELGADGIEWDVVVSKDGKLIISHEPYMHSAFCLDSNGKEIMDKDQKKYNTYVMTAEEIARFDCGSKKNKKYPDQQSAKAYKPTVQEAFSSLDLSKTTVLFEVKSEEKEYDISQPKPAVFARIIKEEISGFEFKKNLIFMCFDANLLEALYKELPEYRYVYLTYKPFVSIANFLKDLSFKPYALGMYYRTIRQRDVKLAHKQMVKIFSWTVNDEKAVEKMTRFAVDGIITDYPNKFVRKSTAP